MQQSGWRVSHCFSNTNKMIRILSIDLNETINIATHNVTAAFTNDNCSWQLFWGTRRSLHCINKQIRYAIEDKCLVLKSKIAITDWDTLIEQLYCTPWSTKRYPSESCPWYIHRPNFRVVLIPTFTDRC